LSLNSWGRQSRRSIWSAAPVAEMFRKTHSLATLPAIPPKVN
jgi:hypothetical protein